MLYEYLCKKCGSRKEVVRHFQRRDQKTICVHCGTRMHRIIVSNPMLNTGKGSKFPGYVYTLSGTPFCSNKYDFKEECKKQGATPHGL